MMFKGRLRFFVSAGVNRGMICSYKEEEGDRKGRKERKRGFSVLGNGREECLCEVYSIMGDKVGEMMGEGGGRVQ